MSIRFSRFGSKSSRTGAIRRSLVGAAAACLMATFGAMSAPGCESGPELTPEAQPLGDSVMKLATVYADRIVFPASAKKKLAEVAVGDVLVSGYGVGLLRRVDSIKSSGGKIVLRTSAASLTDVVVNGSSEVKIEPGASAQSVGPMSEAGDFVGQTFSTDLGGQVLYSADGVTLRIKSGSLVFKAGLDVGLDIRDQKIRSARAIASGDMKIDIATEVEGRLLGSLHREKALWRSPEFSVPLPSIGPVPVKATGRLVVTGIFDAEADGQVSVQVTQAFVASGEMGLRYAEDSGFERVTTFSPDWSVDPPVITAEAKLSARAALRAELQLGLYGGVGKLTVGGAGIDIWAEPFLSTHAQASDALAWGVDGGLDLGGRAKLKILWKEFPTENYTFHVTEQHLLPKNDGDAVPSEPGDCGNGVEDGFESDADCGGACAANCGAGQECASGDD